MLMPSIFGESFLNDFIEPFETSNNSSTFMNTDDYNGYSRRT